MTARALITEANAKRLAKAAKSEGVAIVVKVGETEIIILPDIPDIHKGGQVDEHEGIEL